MAEDKEIDQNSSKVVTDTLMAVANPALYCSNAFRVTALSTDASSRDVMRQADKLKMIEKLGGARSPGAGAVLALSPPPDMHALREATQRLHDPIRRLIDELFWFWPVRTGAAKTDKALAALAKGENQLGTELWLKQEKSKTDKDRIATHNLAVLAHVSALDLEIKASKEKLSAKQQEQRASYWGNAYERWNKLIDEEGFWSRITARIRELDDARLTTGVARNIRQQLPAALLTINARLAMKAAEAGQWNELKRQLDIMHASGFDKDRINTALQHVLNPVREHIKASCRDCEQQANADVEHANIAVDRLLNQAKSMLDILDRFLPADHAMRTSAYDEVAITALNAQIMYGNKAEKWGKALKLLERIRTIAVSQSACHRIDENLEIVRKNAEMEKVHGVCWYCGKEAPDKKHETKYSFYKVISRVMNTVRYQQAKITVPKCAQCADAFKRSTEFNERLGGFMIGGGVMGFIAGIGASNLIRFITGSSLLGWLGAALCIGAYAYLAKILIHDNFGDGALPGGIKPSSSFREFPQIKELLADGWSFGDSPPNVG